MAGALVLILLLLPFVELALFIAVAGEVGFLMALAVIITVGVVGGWLVKRQGLDVWRRAEGRYRSGEMPTAEVVNGLLLLVAGLLLALPGFLSDLMAIALLVPPVRALVRSLLFRRFEQRVQATLAGPAGIAFGGTRTNTGRATYDVREVDDEGPGGPGRPRLERP